ncbi:3-keto-disaccharide hydrolase [Dyadobacter bucti]|uniref:3-keto-disaccharide hydrolase n=1 Tax=Dyadobacter bucti TaxID=2572203 RepID=UPI003F6EF54E
MRRSEFLHLSAAAAGIIPAQNFFQIRSETSVKDKYINLIQGNTLKGWHTSSRIPKPLFPGGKQPDPNRESYKRALTSKGKWTVENGVIIGGQDIEGLGSYLVTDRKYGDFELLIDVKPDWPVDTGILLRAGTDGSPGYQVLLDYRKSGGIGGFYGNGLAGFHALPYNFDARYDVEGKPIGLVAETPSTTIEKITDAKTMMLNYAAPVEEFLKIWNWADWNTFRIRCEGKHPYLTSWINGLKICELDTAKIEFPNYDKEAIANFLGREGHISLEVHDNDPGLGKNRWKPGAVTRWKNIKIRKL